MATPLIGKTDIESIRNNRIDLQDLAESFHNVAASGCGFFQIGIAEGTGEPPVNQKCTDKELKSFLEILNSCSDNIVFRGEIVTHDNNGQYYKIKIPQSFESVTSAHPTSTDPIGICFSSSDSNSEFGVPTRSLFETKTYTEQFVSIMRSWLRNHHASPEDLVRDRKRREALARQGFEFPVSRFPKSSTTQKGNWAEVFLCEYIKSSCDASIPVYRLRYNPNVEQSMKGDDVLAFDLDADPVRIIVGESKFRKAPSKQAVEEIIEALEKSHKGGLPASLQFVANTLFTQGNEELGSRIEECADHFVKGSLRINHIGLLASNQNGFAHVNRNAKTSVHHLAVMSLNLDNCEQIVNDCFASLEEF